MPEGCSKILAQACEARYNGGAGIEATEAMDEECEEWSNEVAALQAVYENMVDILSPGSMCFKTALPQVSQSGFHTGATGSVFHAAVALPF